MTSVLGNVAGEDTFQLYMLRSSATQKLITGDFSGGMCSRNNLWKCGKSGHATHCQDSGLIDLIRTVVMRRRDVTAAHRRAVAAVVSISILVGLHISFHVDGNTGEVILYKENKVTDTVESIYGLTSPFAPKCSYKRD